jgi:hypothetical protein
MHVHSGVWLPVCLLFAVHLFHTIGPAFTTLWCPESGESLKLIYHSRTSWCKSLCPRTIRVLRGEHFSLPNRWKGFIMFLLKRFHYVSLYISTSLKRFHYVSFEKEGTIIWLRYSALAYLLFKFYCSLKGICVASVRQITGEKMCRGWDIALRKGWFQNSKTKLVIFAWIEIWWLRFLIEFSFHQFSGSYGHFPLKTLHFNATKVVYVTCK